MHVVMTIHSAQHVVMTLHNHFCTNIILYKSPVVSYQCQNRVGCQIIMRSPNNFFRRQVNFMRAHDNYTRSPKLIMSLVSDNSVKWLNDFMLSVSDLLAIVLGKYKTWTLDLTTDYRLCMDSIMHSIIGLKF